MFADRQDKAPPTAAQATDESNLEIKENSLPTVAEVEKQGSISFIGSSLSHEVSYSFPADAPGQEKNTGVFTDALLDRLEKGESLKDALQELVGTNVSKTFDKDYASQHPVKDGSEIMDVLSQTRRAPDGGRVILVQGTAESKEEAKGLEKDVDRLEKYFSGKGYEVSKVDSFEEYSKAIQAAEGEELFVYFTGHASMIDPRLVSKPEGSNSPKVISLSRPLKHSSEHEGVFHFRNEKAPNSLKESILVSERDLKTPLVKAQSKVDSIYVFFDVCHAGAFDAKQFMEPNKEAPSPTKIDREKFYIPNRP